MSGVTPWRSTRGQRLLALSQGRNDWYRIKNVATTDDGPAQLHIYDEIGFMGVSASDLIVDLADVSGPLDVHLNSPGGEVNDGLAIYNCLLMRDGVTIYIDGIAASIATVIAMAGEKIKIAPTAQMMVHNAFTFAIGDANDLRVLADRLDENSRNIAGIYAMRTGKPAEYWLDIMADEGWYRGQEAIDAGLADELITTGRARKASPAAHDMSVITNKMRTPPMKDAASHPYHSDHEPMHEPHTGEHSHNHAAFGHGDGDDGIHHHSHYHNNDATHEHAHMSHGHDHQGHDHPHSHAHDDGVHRYGENHDHDHTHHVYDPDHDGDDDSRPDDGHGGGDTDHDYYAAMCHHTGMILDASYDSSAWDGSAAMSSAANSSSPASALNSICAGKRSGDPATREAHALPHHKHPGSPPNKAGVTAALASLHGSREGVSGLTNRSAAEAHLKAHAAAWASGSESSSDSADSEGFSDADAQALIGLLRKG